MTEYGNNYKAFNSIIGVIIESARNVELAKQFVKSVDTLDLTLWQKRKLHELNINTIGELIEVEESKLKEARYIKETRARQIKNAAVAAVCEYLIG